MKSVKRLLLLAFLIGIIAVTCVYAAQERQQPQWDVVVTLCGDSTDEIVASFQSFDLAQTFGDNLLLLMHDGYAIQLTQVSEVRSQMWIRGLSCNRTYPDWTYFEVLY